VTLFVIQQLLDDGCVVVVLGTMSVSTRGPEAAAALDGVTAVLVAGTG
jgi:hypothetical protein